MLYDQWREIAKAQPREIALRDLRSGGCWTFAELLAAGEKTTPPRQNVCHPTGNGSEFIFAVLNCWRTGGTLCPLDPGQNPPDMTGLPNSWAHVKITSGTTGPAQLIGLTEEALAADARNIVSSMGLRPDWPNLALISLSHSYGFSNLITPLLLHGIPLVLGGDPLPEILRVAGDTLPALTLPAVPALWRAWSEARVLPRSLRLAISAGAPLPLSLEKSIYDEFGVKIHNFYGASECGGIAYDAHDEVRTDQAFAGRALRGVELSIAEGDCLMVKSRAVAAGYWPEVNSALNREVFQTQDIAELIEGGVYLRGRATDQMNLAGRKVFPQTVERVLSTHPSVRDSLVFSIPTSQGERNEIMVACVVREGVLTERILGAFLRDRLPAWQVPKEWWFVESLSANHRGKLSRREWKEKYLAGTNKV